MSLNYRLPEDGEVFNTFHDMVHAAILSAGTGSATLKEIYSACLRIGRVKCRKTGGWRLVTERRNWKSHIRHTLYTTEKFLRCPQDPDSWMLAPGFCHTLPQTTRQHSGCNALDDQRQVFSQGGPSPRMGLAPQTNVGGKPETPVFPGERRLVEAGAAVLVHPLQAAGRLSDKSCKHRAAAVQPLEYDDDGQCHDQEEQHLHLQQQEEDGTDHDCYDEDEQPEDEEGEHNDAVRDQGLVGAPSASQRGRGVRQGGAAGHAGTGVRQSELYGLVPYGVGSRSGRVQALLGITAAAAAAEDAEDELDLGDERTRTALLAAQEVLNNPAAARILLNLMRQQQQQLPDPLPEYLARHHGFKQSPAEAAAVGRARPADEGEGEKGERDDDDDNDDVKPRGRPADRSGPGISAGPAAGRHKQSYADGGSGGQKAFWRRPQASRAASAPASDFDAIGTYASAPKARFGTCAPSVGEALPFRSLNSAGVAARRTQLAICAGTSVKGPNSLAAAVGWHELEQRKGDDEEDGVEGQAVELGHDPDCEELHGRRISPQQRRGGYAASEHERLTGVGRGLDAGFPALGFAALSRSGTHGFPQLDPPGTVGERRTLWPRTVLGSQGPLVLPRMLQYGTQPVRAASAPLHMPLAAPGWRLASSPELLSRQASSPPLLAQAAAAAAMLQAAQTVPAAAPVEIEPASRRGSGESGTLGKRRATDSTSGSSFGEDAHVEAEQRLAQVKQLQLPQQRQEQPTKRLCPPVDLDRLAGGFQTLQRRAAAAAAADAASVAAGSDNASLKLSSCLSAFTAY